MSRARKRPPSTAAERLRKGRLALTPTDLRALARLMRDDKLADAAAAIEAANRLADDLEAGLEAAKRGEWAIDDLLDDEDVPLVP